MFLVEDVGGEQDPCHVHGVGHSVADISSGGWRSRISGMYISGGGGTQWEMSTVWNGKERRISCT